MEQDTVFTSFISSRNRLMESLDAERKELERWLDSHRVGQASIAELAHLQGLLEERRRHLAQLLKLDDDLLDHLVSVLGTRAVSSDGH